MQDAATSDPTSAAPGPTGVVLIGNRESAKPYLRAFTNLDVRVVGLLDLSTSDGTAAGDTTTHLQSSDPHTAVGWDGVDAFIHCGPLAGDPATVSVIAASGKPVFVDSRGGRHRADAQTIRGCIETGEIGRVVFARFAAGNRAEDTGTTTDADPQLAWQQRAQILDMLGWWIGEDPEVVYAQRTPDYESVTIRYSDGATAVCDISSAGPAYREVVVVGTSASMSLTWADHASVLLPADGTRAQSLDGSPSLRAVLEEWLERVRSGAAPIIDESEFATAVALEDAFERSIASGREANVKISRDGSRA